LELNETVVRDLTPLRGVNTLAVLYAGSTDVTDIGPLTALPLTSLSLANTAVRDFSPLKSMPLRSLNLSGCHVSDISMLSGKSLEFVDLSGTRVSDLSPLQMSLTLRSLNIRNTQVSDLSPISKAPLSSLDCRGIPTADFSALRRMPIENLCIDQSPQVLPVLLSMPKLRYVNGVVWDRLSHVPGKMNRPTRKIRRDRDG
jgi:Leucine-rich repeat (LRR) protein